MLYKVQTEGDCEGRTMRSLGIWEGNIADIALHLAEHCVYTLYFDECEIQRPSKVTRKKVSIRYPQNSLNELSMDKRFAKTQAGCGVISVETQKEEDDRKTRELLSKLSVEEIQLLKKNFSGD